MAQSVLTVKIDVPIPVATEPEVDLLFDLSKIGSEGVHDGTMWCPVTKTVFVRPHEFDPNDIRDPLALTPDDPANWEEVTIGSGGIFKLSKNGSTGWLTSAYQSANTAFVVTFYCYGQTGGINSYEVMQLQFGGMTLYVNSDGLSSIGDQRGYLSGGYAVEGMGRGALNDRWVRLFILPLNRRDILIYSDAGGAWVYRQLDLALEDSDNEIIPADVIKVKFPNSKALVQVQEAAFLNTCKYTTPVIDLGYKPKDNGINADVVVWYDGEPPESWRLLTGAGAVVCTSSAAGKPDGSTSQFKMEVTLGSTTQLYGAGICFAGKQDTRQGASSNLANRELVIDPADGAWRQSLVHVVDPGAGVPNNEGWPLGLREGASVAVMDENDQEVFLGLMAPPKLVGAQAPAAKVDSGGLLWKMLAQAVFRSDWRVDGLYEGELVLKCLRLAGLTDLSSFTNDIAEDERVKVHKGTQITGDPRGKITCFPVKAGENAAALLKRMLDLWSNWPLQMRKLAGKQKVYFGPESEETTPVKTFYRSHLMAGWENSYWSDLKLTRARRSCKDGVPWNSVVVRGRDPDGPYVYGTYDPDSKVTDPSLAETDRPAEWFGAPLVKYYEDERLRTQAAIDHVKDILKWRFVDLVETATWSADYDKRVERGSLVAVEGHGNYRVLSMTPLPEPVDITQYPYRPTEYVGEKVD